MNWTHVMRVSLMHDVGEIQYIRDLIPPHTLSATDQVSDGENNDVNG